jgi:Secretion system C-terminal sorting domain
VTVNALFNILKMKILILSINLLFGCLFLYGQKTATEVWKNKEFVKSPYFGNSKIVRDKSKNVWMITNQTDENPLGGYTLKKFDSIGTELWKIKYENDFLGHGYRDLVVDSLGNSYVCFGLNYLQGLKGETRIVKYSSDGQIIWDVNHGAEYIWTNEGWFCGLDFAGDLYLTGYTWGDSTIKNNIFVSKLDKSTGNTIWKKLFPDYSSPQNFAVIGNTLEIFSTVYKQNGKNFRIIQLNKNDGQVLQDVMKQYSTMWLLDFTKICSNGDVMLGTRGPEFTVTRINSFGDTLWHYEKIGWLGRVFSFYEAKNDNSVYSIGTFWQTSNDAAEMVTTKFNQLGDVLWEKSFPNNLDIISAGGEALEVQDSLVYCIGSSDKLMDTGRVQIVVYNELTGDEKLAVDFKEDKICGGYQILPLNDGFVYCGFSNFGEFGTEYILTGRFKFSNIIGVEEDKIGNKLQVFPNPTHDVIQVSLHNVSLSSQNLSFSLISSSGNLLLRHKIFQNRFEIDVSQFGSGSYLLNIYQKNRIISTKKLEVIH